jgi:2-polyprenyl-3-methyl-5-hydroxy-6-metoxy-1,4-benzoquinol methylase
MLETGGLPCLNELINRVLERWPEHQPYIEKSLCQRSTEALKLSDELASNVIKLSGGTDGGICQFVDDYRFFCESILLPEQMYFRRHGKYRVSTFAEAERECYANSDFMKRYMNGLLVSNPLWSHHANAFHHYVANYLAGLPQGAAHLEVGPGHGLFLCYAARSRAIGAVAGWDISPQSVAHTGAALKTLGVEQPVDLRVSNLFEAGAAGAKFDGIVMSEILEHLEDPGGALRAASRHLKPGGLIWINVPANSPAPDHIYLFNDLDDARALVTEAGFEVVDSAAFPMPGATLEKARKRKLAVSCVVLGRYTH